VQAKGGENYMFIHEVLEKTRLTKKAVAYYEKCGLLKPITA
jgi:DNA-binding transcriptional MerR regulator